MKHLLRAVVLCLVWLTAYFPVSGFKVTNSDGVSISYTELTSTTCEVSGYSGTLSYPYKITVPSTVSYNGRTYTVVSVSDYGSWSNGTIRSVSLPETITVIGKNAFSDCKNLTTIDLPSSLTEIGNGAFNSCESLSTINLPISLTSIGYQAFCGCKSLTSITLPENLEFLGDYSFSGCSALTTVYYNAINCITDNGPCWGGGIYDINTTLNKVYIGSSVKVIPNHLFYSIGISSISLPYGVEKIGEYAFDCCRNLERIEMPNTVKSIGKGAFYGAQAMKSVDLGEKLEYIGDHAFQSCLSLTSIDIPNSVKHFGKSPFRFNAMSFYGKGASDDHRSLVHNDTLVQWSPMLTDENFDVRIPKGVKYIGEEAIAGWSKINSVDIPETVLEIGSYAFIYSNIRTLMIPNSVASIGDYAIDGSAMKSIIIPSSVKHMGRYAIKASTVIMLSENPSDVTFDGQMDWSQIYVPKGSLSAYNNLGIISNSNNIHEMIYALTDGNTYRGAKNSSYSYIDLPYSYVTYTRNFTKTTWQAFYVPYDMPYEDWAQYGDIARINNVHQFDTDDDGVIDETKIEFVKVKSGRLVPNIPYVFKPKEVGEVTFESEKCMLKAAPAENGYVDCSSTTTTYTLTGVYSTTSELYSKGAYTLFDGAFRPIGADNVTLSPFRFYMTITPREGFYNDPSQVSNPHRIRMYVDGEEQTTGFEDLIIKPTDNDLYYDLQGRPVANPTNGIYIKNGKKIFINH